jgi:hypothetical protein
MEEAEFIESAALSRDVMPVKPPTPGGGRVLLASSPKSFTHPSSKELFYD